MLFKPFSSGTCFCPEHGLTSCAEQRLDSIDDGFDVSVEDGADAVADAEEMVGGDVTQLLGDLLECLRVVAAFPIHAGRQ